MVFSRSGSSQITRKPARASVTPNPLGVDVSPKEIDMSLSYDDLVNLVPGFGGTPPPGAVSNLAITGASGGVVADFTPEATWDAVAGADAYTLQYDTDIGFGSPVEVTSIATNSYTHPSALMHNTTYYWRVAAVNANGQGQWSDSANALVYNFEAAILALDPLLFLYAGDGADIPAQMNGAADGGVVTTWNDLSTNAYHVTQTGADTLKPVYDQSNPIINNRGCLTFDGNDWLGRNIVTPVLGNTRPVTSYAVFFTTSAILSPAMFSEGDASSTGPFFVIGLNNPASKVWGANRDQSSTIYAPLAGGSGANDGNAHLLTFRRINATDYSLRLDGVEVASITVADINNSQSDQLTVGASRRTSISNYYTGSEALVVHFNSSNYETVEPLIAEHYGVALA